MRWVRQLYASCGQFGLLAVEARTLAYPSIIGINKVREDKDITHLLVLIIFSVATLSTSEMRLLLSLDMLVSGSTARDMRDRIP